MANLKHWCTCDTVTFVKRDMYATCCKCGGKDAYKKSPENPLNPRNVLIRETVAKLRSALSGLEDRAIIDECLAKLDGVCNG